MASHKASSIGSPESFDDVSTHTTPQVQSKAFYASDENAISFGSDAAEQDPDLHATQADSPLDVATTSVSDKKEDSPALDTSTSTANYSLKAGSADSATLFYDENESDSLTDQANEDSSQDVIGEVHADQNISSHASQDLDDHFFNNNEICNFTGSPVGDWTNLEGVASDGKLWQLVQAGAMSSQVQHQSSQQSVTSPGNGSTEPNHFNAADDQDDTQSLHPIERYSPASEQSEGFYFDKHDLQPESYFLGSQQQPATHCSTNQQDQGPDNDANDDQQTYRIPTVQLSGELSGSEPGLQPESYLPGSQQHSGHWYAGRYQPINPSSRRQQYDNEVYFDETDLQYSPYVSGNQPNSQFYQHQSYYPECHTHFESHQQHAFAEQSSLPADFASTAAFNTEDTTNFFDNDDDDATVDEAKPEEPALSIEVQMAELRKQIALVQANTQATLVKITQNEKRIQEIDAILKSPKRKRTDKADESAQVPKKKTKIQSYRRPSTRKEPKMKAPKVTKKSRTAGSPLQFIEYVPELQVESSKLRDADTPDQGLGIQFNSSTPQAGNSYHSQASGIAQDIRSQLEWFDEPAPQVQNTHQANASSYSQAAESQFESFSQSFSQAQNYSQTAETQFESFNQSSPQAQISYQPTTQRYDQHAENQYSQLSPVMNQTHHTNTSSGTSYHKAHIVQDLDFTALLNELGQYPTDNYGGHATQAMAANGYPLFPFGVPSSGSVQWNGY